MQQRPPGAIRTGNVAEFPQAAQARLPTDVQAFLAQHGDELPDEALRSPEYALQTFFVQIAANCGRTADRLVQFVRPGDLAPEVEEALAQRLAVVTKPGRAAVARDDLLRPLDVVGLVSARLPFKIHHRHSPACLEEFCGATATGSAEPEATDERYCRWDRLSRCYDYTSAWVERLVADLSEADLYEAVVGFAPEVR